MARDLPEGAITVERYAQAYRAADRRAERARQIALTSEIGEYLDGVVRKPMVRGLVRLARGPAHAAGFGLLQEFLERGLDAFEAMHGAQEFLGTLRAREERAMARLFAGDPDPFEFGATSGRAGKEGRRLDERKWPDDRHRSGRKKAVRKPPPHWRKYLTQAELELPPPTDGLDRPRRGSRPTSTNRRGVRARLVAAGGLRGRAGRRLCGTRGGWQARRC